jgi:phenylpropionate dioxygenase-like ring-hydroxylating dioxygenase large terminal subunit
MFIKNAWYVAAWADEVAGQPLARRILNEPIVLFRDGKQRAAALADMCCHRGAPLSCGRVVESGLECGYHGMVYGADGACVHIPGQVHIPPKARVKSYPLVEKDTCLWIWMGDPAAADPARIVDYPYHNDAARWPHMHTLYPIRGSANLMIDNLMDLTHLGYVHGSTIGGNPKSHVEAIMDTQPTDTGLKFTRWMLDSPAPPTYKKAVPTLADRIDRWQEFEFVAPGTVLQWVGALDAGTGAYDQGKRDGGFSMRVFHALTPETETECHYFWSTLNGFRPHDPQATLAIFDEVSAAFKEDQYIVQQQQARLTECGDEKLINIVADGARVHMRRVLDKMLAAEVGSAQQPAGV